MTEKTEHLITSLMAFVLGLLTSALIFLSLGFRIR
jgi:hypothetical protein